MQTWDQSVVDCRTLFDNLFDFSICPAFLFDSILSFVSADPTCDGHMQVWLGYQQSLRPSQAGLTLNMDMAATAFLEPQPVVDYLLRAVGMRTPQDFARLTPQQHRTASKAITGIRVSGRRISGVIRLQISNLQSQTESNLMHR